MLIQMTLTFPKAGRSATVGTSLSGSGRFQSDCQWAQSRSGLVGLRSPVATVTPALRSRTLIQTPAAFGGPGPLANGGALLAPDPGPAWDGASPGLAPLASPGPAPRPRPPGIGLPAWTAGRPGLGPRATQVPLSGAARPGRARDRQCPGRRVSLQARRNEGRGRGPENRGRGHCARHGDLELAARASDARADAHLLISTDADPSHHHTGRLALHA